MSDTERPSPVTLPEADWRHHAGLERIVTALGPDNVRIVGGAVRDALAGQPVEDVDLATPIPPQRVIEQLDAVGIRTVPTGIAHGTITAVANHRPYEITTLRRDVSTDGRNATVAFATDWKEDAARRDFTINALYADLVTGAVTDYFGGIDDLAHRRVRFIGDAATRIREDHLRILRYFRFQARYGGPDADADTLAVIADHAATLRSLSRERVAGELLRLLALPDPAPSVRLMDDARLFGHIAAGFDAGMHARLAQLLAAERDTRTAPDAMRRFMAILPRDAEVAQAIAAKLKLSNVQRKRIAAAVPPVPQSAESARALAYRIGSAAVVDQALLSQAPDASATLAVLADWQAPTLTVKGGDLIALGVPPGPDVARALRAIEDQWVAEGFPDAARVDAIARAAIAAISAP